MKEYDEINAERQNLMGKVKYQQTKNLALAMPKEGTDTYLHAHISENWVQLYRTFLIKLDNSIHRMYVCNKSRMNSK